MIGIVAMYSSSAIYAQEIYGNSAYFLVRQLVAVFCGLILFIAALTFDLSVIVKHAKKILGLSIVLLIIVLVPKLGKEGGGASRWIDLGLFYFQPSELAKIAIILYLANFIQRKENILTDFFYGYLPPILLSLFLMLLIVVEPDLGTALAIGIVTITILFSFGARLKHIFLTLLSGLPVVMYLVLSTPYRKRRFLAFINPLSDERGAGFQIVQSMIALGSGGAFGVGLGQSKQKLFFLPAAHTDFIYSIIGEETGFVGSVFIIMLFGFLIFCCMRAGLKSAYTFKKVIILGVTCMIGFEVLINIAVSLGLFPTKGLPLPFISYGGTSLIMHMAAMGLLLNATR